MYVAVNIRIYELLYLEHCYLWKLFIWQANISIKGTYQELQSSTFDFAKLLETSEETSYECDDKALINNSIRHNTGSKLDSRHSASSNSENKQTSVITASKEKEKNRPSVNIPINVYVTYLSASGSFCRIILFFSLFVFTQVMITGGDYWLGFWY